MINKRVDEKTGVATEKEGFPGWAENSNIDVGGGNSTPAAEAREPSTTGILSSHMCHSRDFHESHWGRATCHFRNLCVVVPKFEGSDEEYHTKQTTPASLQWYYVVPGPGDQTPCQCTQQLSASALCRRRH